LRKYEAGRQGMYLAEMISFAIAVLTSSTTACHREITEVKASVFINYNFGDFSNIFF